MIIRLILRSENKSELSSELILSFYPHLRFVFEKNPLELGSDKTVRAAFPAVAARHRPADKLSSFPELDPNLLLLTELGELISISH